MLTFNAAVGYTLRKIRQEKNLTLRQVSSKSFVALGHLSDIERATKSPSLVVIEQVCINGLDIQMTELMKEIYKTLKESETNG
jgi:transcriptional regulator with XRE-family HTH domain